MIEDPMDPALASLIDEERAVAAAEDPPLGAMQARLLMSVGVAGAATLSASTAAAAASDVAKVTAVTLKTKLIGAVVVAAVSADRARPFKSTSTIADTKRCSAPSSRP